MSTRSPPLSCNTWQHTRTRHKECNALDCYQATFAHQAIKVVYKLILSCAKSNGMAAANLTLTWADGCVLLRLLQQKGAVHMSSCSGDVAETYPWVLAATQGWCQLMPTTSDNAYHLNTLAGLKGCHVAASHDVASTNECCDPPVPHCCEHTHSCGAKWLPHTSAPTVPTNL
jgi:hypothetical protein